jgi:hypothetical protein
VRFSFYLPTRGPTATRDGVLVLAREGERLDMHSATIADHIVFPVESDSIYPHTLDRRHPGGGDAPETFSILGVVAGQHLATLKRLPDAGGRDSSALTISYKAPLYDVASPDREGSRRSSAESTRLQRFAAEVIPLAGEQPCH